MNPVHWFSGHSIKRRQVINENGLLIKAWWLGALYKAVPFIFSDENSVPTPLIFLPIVEDYVTNFSKSIGLPNIVHDDSDPYTLNKMARLLFGVNFIQLIGISLLVFAASLALVRRFIKIKSTCLLLLTILEIFQVVIILPSLYFRLMLSADYSTSNKLPT